MKTAFIIFLFLFSARQVHADGGIIGKMKQVLQKVQDSDQTTPRQESFGAAQEAVFNDWTDEDRSALKGWYPKATDEDLKRYEQMVKDFLRDPKKRTFLDAIDAGTMDAAGAADLASGKMEEAGRENSAEKALDAIEYAVDYAAGALDATDASSRLLGKDATLAESIGQTRADLQDLKSDLTKAQYAAKGTQETLDLLRGRSETAGAFAEGGKLADTVLGKTTDLIDKVDRYAGIAEGLLTDDPEKKILALEGEAAHWLGKIGDSGQIAGPMSHIMKGTLETRRELGNKVNRDMRNLSRMVNTDDEATRAAAFEDLSTGAPDTRQYAKDFVKHVIEKSWESANPFADSGRSEPQKEEPGLFTKIRNGLFPSYAEPQSQARERDRAYREKMRNAFLKG